MADLYLSSVSADPRDVAQGSRRMQDMVATSADSAIRALERDATFPQDLSMANPQDYET